MDGVSGAHSPCLRLDPASEDRRDHRDGRCRPSDAHVESLCAIGPRPGGDKEATDATLDYLERELRSYGYEPQRKEFFAWTRVWTRKEDAKGEVSFGMHTERRSQHNLIVEHRGVSESEVVVELGRHYDTVVFGPGADDNTSGVTAVVEVARAIARCRVSR